MSHTDPHRRALIAQLRITLALIEPLDPSTPANEGRFQHPAVAYRSRNALVYKAVGLATGLGLPAGLDVDPDDPDQLVAYLELPDAGQVSWHLPRYPNRWDGHTTQEKYARTREFIGARKLPA